MSVPFRCQCTRCKLTRAERGIPLGPIMPSETRDGIALKPSRPRQYPTRYFDQKPLAFEVDSVRPRNCE
jgi:hypothetical protein